MSDEQLFVFVTIVIRIFESCEHSFVVESKKCINDLPQI